MAKGRKTTTFTLRIPDNLYKEFVARAELNELSRNQMAKLLFERGLRSHHAKEKQNRKVTPKGQRVVGVVE